ncbi:MAG: SCO family protein [Longimicrobiales bacterium]
MASGVAEKDRTTNGIDRTESGVSRVALFSLGAILVVTIAWWALALWPTGGVPPGWLLRARQVCFNAGPSGLPDASGWLLLIGQPIGMVAMLMVVAGDGVRGGLRQARQRPLGRFGLALGVVIPLVGLTLAGVRVSSAAGEGEWLEVAGEAVPSSYPRLDRSPPPLGLVDQSGDVVDWSDFAGSPVIVTFGFGHCETICPLMVHNAVRVQEMLELEGLQVSVVVITLDPWRDTPNRLPHLADQFMLGERGHLLSGPVEDVNRVLDDLKMARERDPQTGDVTHPSLAYILDGDGTIAYGATGHARLIEELIRRL